ncbi:hypothetical protein GON03_07400 [Nocardioides sp. MAH-18]|uniref:Uncharacterized protein n=1 Tax=Nocardioides agri TaxID=2682843 RepID=A0A6L6XP19_9ACTN|nr:MULTISPECIES: hypothetical protein [unclassified Nocardioides]MBA2954142.1 hypothetical protein [Nocardioides sp. CGMCC 1.13656]MVQ49004.1 hypothetical protein [Nocardioides sp. MAH-18]
MQVLTALPHVLTAVVSFADRTPEPEDVKAGWLAFGIFIGLILAVAFLGWSLVKQLRKVDAAEEAGLYDPSDRKPAVSLPVEPPVERSAEQRTEPGDDTRD